MNMSKIALLGLGAAGLVLSTTAQAAATRATMPVASVKAKAKKVSTLSRTSAPIANESNIAPAGIVLLVAGLGLAAYGAAEGLKDDSPGA
jgi:hypothetical protein